MDGKYTPGPWEETENMDGDLIVRMDISHMIVIGNLEDTCSVCHANARLIAAAPELLEALIFMVEQITNEKNANHTLEAYTHGAGIDMAKKAIAKAKGE